MAILLLLAALAAPSPACPNRDFDFWIGAWDVRVRARATPDGPWGEASAKNQVDATYGGCVIEERFRSEGPGRPWAGHSVSVFSGGKWRQTWVDDTGGFIVLEGGMEDGRMVLRTEPQTRNGKTVQMRMVYSRITLDSLHWSWERTDDGGGAWAPMMTADYSRRKG